MNNKFSRLKGAFLLLVTVLLTPSLSYACGNAMEEEGVFFFLYLASDSSIASLFILPIIVAAIIGAYNTLARGHAPFLGMKWLFALVSFGIVLLLGAILVSESVSFAAGLLQGMIAPVISFMIILAIIGACKTLGRGRILFLGMKWLFALVSFGIVLFLAADLAGSGSFVEMLQESKYGLQDTAITLIKLLIVMPVLAIFSMAGIGILSALVVLPRIPLHITCFDLPVIRKQQGHDKIWTLSKIIIKNGAWIFAILLVLFALFMFIYQERLDLIFPVVSALPGLLVLLSLPIAVWIAIRPQGKVAQVARRFSDIDNEIRLVLQFLNGKDPKPSY